MKAIFGIVGSFYFLVGLGMFGICAVCYPGQLRAAHQEAQRRKGVVLPINSTVLKILIVACVLWPYTLYLSLTRPLPKWHCEDKDA